MRRLRGFVRDIRAARARRGRRMPDLSWRQTEPRDVRVCASSQRTRRGRVRCGLRRAVRRRMLRRLVRLPPLGRASRGLVATTPFSGREVRRGRAKARPPPPHLSASPRTGLARISARALCAWHAAKLQGLSSKAAQPRSAGPRAGNQLGTRNQGGKAEPQALEQTCRARAAYSATIERKNEHKRYPPWLVSNSAFASLSSSGCANKSYAVIAIALATRIIAAYPRSESAYLTNVSSWQLPLPVSEIWKSG